MSSPLSEPMSGSMSTSALAVDSPSTLASQVPDTEELQDFAREHLAGRLDGSRGLVLSVPAPVAPPELLLAADGDPSTGVLWAPAQGAAMAGLGSSHHLRLRGAQRLQKLRRASNELFARLEEFHHPDSTAPAPRLLGGLSFAVGSADQGSWSPFGDGFFDLPRWLYRSDGEQASLSLNLPAGCEENPADLVRELGRILGVLETSGDDPATALAAWATGASPVSVEQMPEEVWHRQVEAIREAIAAGNFRKIVAARRAEVTFSRPLDPLSLLMRLRQCGPHCRRFTFQRPGLAFLGATPERLIRRQGHRIATEALAGSIGSGEGNGRRQGRRLLESQKDLGEHQLVVEHIIGRLQPLCRQLDWSREPQIRELRNLLHLHTPIRGELREDTHVLKLVELLHPTPAVGGVPAAAATRWIAEHELQARGWYAGPVGWFDAAGNGEFDVALRSCLLAGNRALVYAGAGIMLDSDPHLEYQETDLKQRSLLAALGVGE